MMLLWNIKKMLIMLKIVVKELKIGL